MIMPFRVETAPWPDDMLYHTLRDKLAASLQMLVRESYDRSPRPPCIQTGPGSQTARLARREAYLAGCDPNFHDGRHGIAYP